MRQVTKTIYIADDGRQFDTKEEAVNHELALAIDDAWTNANIDFREPDVGELIRVLLREFCIVPRNKNTVTGE